MARYFPSALNVAGRSCLVIGNDRDALGKSLRLLDAGAQVRVQAPFFSPEQKRELTAAGATLVKTDYNAVEIAADLFFVILCPKDDPVLTARIARECRRQRILLCAIDQPAYCDVVNVSVMDEGRLRITIGTGGAAPSLSRKIREGLERSLKGKKLAAYVDHLALLRERYETEIRDVMARRRALIKATDGFKFEARIRLPKEWKDRAGSSTKGRKKK